MPLQMFLTFNLLTEDLSVLCDLRQAEIMAMIKFSWMSKICSSQKNNFLTYINQKTYTLNCTVKIILYQPFIVSNSKSPQVLTWCVSMFKALFCYSCMRSDQSNDYPMTKKNVVYVRKINSIYC